MIVNVANKIPFSFAHSVVGYSLLCLSLSMCSFSFFPSPSVCPYPPISAFSSYIFLYSLSPSSSLHPPPPLSSAPSSPASYPTSLSLATFHLTLLSLTTFLPFLSPSSYQPPFPLNSFLLPSLSPHYASILSLSPLPFLFISSISFSYMPLTYSAGC